MKSSSPGYFASIDLMPSMTSFGGPQNHAFCLTPSASLGTLAGGSLEMSNVDLSQEFTNLIVAQRGFQANARIITTSDEVLQELTNLKR